MALKVTSSYYHNTCRGLQVKTYFVAIRPEPSFSQRASHSVGEYQRKSERVLNLTHFQAPSDRCELGHPQCHGPLQRSTAETRADDLVSTVSTACIKPAARTTKP
jgi:hypothetical protein